MRNYEIVYIFRSSLEDEEIESKLDRYHERLGDADLTAVEHWGKRQLAYEIAGERNGYYVVVQFTADPGRIGELEQVLKMDEDLLRHLIVLSEGEAPVPPSMRREEPEEEPEPDEDEEEDEEDQEDEEDEEDEADDEDEDEDEEGDGDDEEEDDDEEDDDEEDEDEASEEDDDEDEDEADEEE